MSLNLGAVYELTILHFKHNISTILRGETGDPLLLGGDIPYPPPHNPWCPPPHCLVNWRPWIEHRNGDSLPISFMWALLQILCTTRGKRERRSLSWRLFHPARIWDKWRPRRWNQLLISIENVEIWWFLTHTLKSLEYLLHVSSSRTEPP